MFPSGPSSLESLLMRQMLMEKNKPQPPKVIDLNQGRGGGGGGINPIGLIKLLKGLLGGPGGKDRDPLAEILPIKLDSGPSHDYMEGT